MHMYILKCICKHTCVFFFGKLMLSENKNEKSVNYNTLSVNDSNISTDSFNLQGRD
jgi:hypothetical protein